MCPWVVNLELFGSYLYVFMTIVLLSIFMFITYVIHHLCYIKHRDRPKEYILQIEY
jgi:hypothetical protein